VSLSTGEVRLLLDRIEPQFRLIAQLLHGCRLRLNECLSLRYKDVDFERRQMMVRRGKGSKDRPALLPEQVREDLRAQLLLVEKRHRAELAAGRGEVDLTSP
jgi:integrase